MAWGCCWLPWHGCWWMTVVSQHIHRSNATNGSWSGLYRNVTWQWMYGTENSYIAQQVHECMVISNSQNQSWIFTKCDQERSYVCSYFASWSNFHIHPHHEQLSNMNLLQSLQIQSQHLWSHLQQHQERLKDWLRLLLRLLRQVCYLG